MEHSYLEGTNDGMTATDTQKNMCYFVAKQLDRPCSVEEYAIALGRKFVSEYPLVSAAIIEVDQKPWQRVSVDGEADVQSGFRELRLCKTTQSGYEGFHRDQYTLLPDTKERLMASSVTCTWSYFGGAQDYDMEYKKIRQKLVDAFFGTPKSGVYSPSVQKTLYEMGESVIDGCPEVEWIMLNMPNLHFNPLHPVASKFEHD